MGIMRSRIFTFVKCIVLYVFTIQPLLSPYARILLTIDTTTHQSQVYAASASTTPTPAALRIQKYKAEQTKIKKSDV